MDNPVTSIEQWFDGVGHGSAQVTLYEALCMEEQAETMTEFAVTDGNTVDSEQAHFAAALAEYSRLLRTYPELRVVARDRNRLVDGHLDSAWVHLCAAAAVLGDVSRLREAWSRLHNANIVAKQVDGVFVRDQSGKVIKPHNWQAPDYTDLITPKEIPE